MRWSCLWRSDIEDRFYIELNTSINGATFGLDFDKVANPNLTERQQKQGGFDFDAFGERLVRIGVGFVLNKKNGTGVDGN